MADETSQFFMEGVPYVLLQLSHDGTILHINRLPGVLSVSDVRGTTIYEHLPPAARAQVRRALADVFALAELRHLDLPIVFEDGTVHWYSASAGPVVFGERVISATVVAQDTTEQKNAELALRESEAHRLLVEHAPEAIVVLDRDAGRFVDANANACILFGLNREQLLIADPVELSLPVQPDDRQSQTAMNEHLDRALAGDTPVFEWTHIGAAGRAIPCEVRLVRQPPKTRRLVRMSIVDISARRELEHQVAQFQKLDTLGHVAGGIAHDFDNVLSVIDASAQALLATLPEKSESRRIALEIRAATERGAQLSSQILSFARNREPMREPVDLNAAIGHVVLMLSRLLGSDVSIEQHLHPDGAVVHADQGHIHQILANILLNARDAMPKGGRILVETSPVENENAFLLRITDEGTGMDEPTMARIFEPFFTTKPHGRGTGLGLSTTSMLVRQYGGRIFVSSSPGAGATFAIVLPAPPPDERKALE